jgi:Cu-Zn family superoxide dismutase
MAKRLWIAAAALAVGGLVPCGFGQGMSGAKEAIAVIQPASGSMCKGIVRFTAQGSGVKVVADLEGLAAGAKHGFHVHEFGDCSAPDAMSAGGHYDPAGSKHHGSPTDTPRHAGDMGNLQADAAGKAHLELVLEGVALEGSHAPLLGRGVIVHAKPDDFGQPVGNAGARIGCGIIGVSKPAAK